MLINFQDIKPNYDLVVIGAGPAGLVFAREYLRLASHKPRVLIIESGDAVQLKSDAQELSRYTATGDLPADYYPLHNQRVLGGTSTVWSGFCATLEKRSFLRGEWPIEYDDFAAYYPAAAKILGLPNNVYQRAESEFNANENIVYRPYYLSSPKRFNDESTVSWLESEQSIDFVSNTTLEYLTLKGSKLESVGLVSSYKNKQIRKTISMRRAVLAAGGIQNARILQQTFQRNSPKALGRYFSEHPHVYRQLELTLDYELLSENLDLEGDQTVHAIALSSQFLHDNDLLSVTLDITDLRVKNANLLGQRRKVVQMQSTVRSEMSPKLSNRVAFMDASNKDFLGQTMSNINLKFEPNEVVSSVNALAEQLLRSGLGRLSLMPEQFDITGGGHMIGSTRMGRDPLTSVVDSNCQVHNINNLYVAGSSVFPATAAANPTYTIVALSLRLANHLENIDSSQGAA